MKTRGFWTLEALSDAELEGGLQALLHSGYRTEARIVAHLAEVDARRLHLKAASPSLFQYCLQRLQLSESEAYHRITAARIARCYPVVFELLERRELHLTALCLLRDFLTSDNHAQLLAEASRKTKAEVQELLARRFPRPDVPSGLRKLPTGRSTPRSVVASQPANAASIDAPEQVQLPVGDGAGRSIGRHAAARMEPLSGTSYRLQLLASAELKRKLELARDLLSHANPSGDFASVIERALDLLIERIKRERFAQTKCAAESERRGRSGTAPAGGPATDPTAAGGPAPAPAPAPAPHPDRARVHGRSGVSSHTTSGAAASQSYGTTRERIPSVVRRAVALRDGLSCSYVSHEGQRCSSRAFLEIHHEQAWALGGPDTVDNLRLLCRSHNRLIAEQDFGASRVHASIERRRLGRGESGQGPATSQAEPPQRVKPATGQAEATTSQAEATTSQAKLATSQAEARNESG